MADSPSRQPTYSVLLPTHNRADVLPFALRSVLGQTVADFELLVVGDGCTDRTAEVVAGFDDARVRWLDLPKAPHFGYANRNVALREARGRYVAFMAHDDLWLPDHLEMLTACIEASGAEIVYSRPLWVIPVGLLAPCTFNLNDPDTLDAFVSRRLNVIPASCVVHRRECFDRYGYWDESLPARGDLDMWARIIEGGGRKNFAHLPEPTCLHFRANWRKEADVQQPQLHVWKALHMMEGFVPAALKIDVPQGMTEQEACWSALAASPERWTRNLRTALTAALDRRIIMSDELLFELLSKAEAGASGRADLLKSFTQIEELKRIASEVEFLESSAGWKLIRRIRRLRESLFPQGTRRERLLIRIESSLR
ncbi:MAG TPA: glycosyltransferase family A protein [Pyrinomonadaceae bacterium]|nr:glycosyltransferase family A protein [Pyrinomonadaceae bacterium]